MQYAKLSGKMILLGLTLSACAPSYQMPCDVSVIPKPLDPVEHCKSDDCVKQQCVLFCRHYPNECAEVCGE